MDLVIKHKAGRINTNADTLSRNPSAIVCTVSASASSDESAPSVDTEKMDEIQVAQRSDAALVVMCVYLEHGVLPSDEKLAKRIVVESSR